MTPSGIQVTERDLAMFASLANVRYLTAPAIEWLHYPGWYERWTRARAKEYICSSRLYDRLRRLSATGWIASARPAVRPSGTEGAMPALYALTAQGADRLAELTDRPRATMLTEDGDSPAATNHTAAIGQSYAAIRAAIEATPGVWMSDWRSDAMTARSHDGIQPDGVFRLRDKDRAILCFLEVDRARAVATWREKIQTYRSYTGSQALRDRYATDTFLLLCVTTTADYRHRLMKATAEVLEQPSRRFLFCETAAVHPTTIGASWWRIEQVQPVQATPHALLRPAWRAESRAGIRAEPHAAGRAGTGDGAVSV